MSRVLCARYFVVSLLALAGCSPSRMPTVEVTARLTVDSAPFGPASLSLSPIDQKSGIPNCGGMVDKDGTISFQSYPDVDGLVPGMYSVNLLPSSMDMVVPIVEPVVIDVKAPGQAFVVEMKTVKNATPGMVPITIDGSGAPVSSITPASPLAP